MPALVGSDRLASTLSATGMVTCDLLVVGAGTAGLPTAIFAAQAGASVLLVEAADAIGGTLHLSAGQISAAGTALQRAKGIEDDPEHHYQDIMRISRGSAHPDLTRLAVTHLPGTFAWLVESGVPFPSEHPVIDPVNEPYSVARTYWPANGGRDILAVIRGQFDALCADGGIELRLGTKLERLVVERQRAIGAELSDGSAVRASAIVLATGGFTANASLFTSITRRPKHGGGYEFARGEGLLAALDVGGQVVNQDKFLPAFAAVEDATARDGFKFETVLDPALRPPWELYIDTEGRRFMREDEPWLGGRQRALSGLPSLQFWVVWDARIERDAPRLFPKLERDELEARFLSGAPGFVEGGSLPELAGKMKVDAAMLCAEVARYNGTLAGSLPDPFGRTFRPCAVGLPPFRAVRHSGWSATGFPGLAVDHELRVVDANGAAIRGLYAAGEILGMAATSGRSYCSGMSIGPALTFGKLLGGRLGKLTRAENSEGL